MITNTGKSILAKYLIGQAPAYASYIAVGCGPKAKNSGVPFSNSELLEMRNKKTLDYEMHRVPITSRGYVTEDGVSKIVFTAELDTNPRYEITEVGLFSVKSNTIAGSYDSKSLFSFSHDESWQYYNGTAQSTIPQILTPLSTNTSISAVSNNIIGSYNVGVDGAIVACPVIKTTSDNTVFNSTSRISRNERSRYLNETILVAGNTSTLNVVSSKLQPAAGSKYLIANGVSVDLTKNSSSDQIKLAFSIVNKNDDATVVPDKVRILLQFLSSDGLKYANMEVDITKDNASYDFSTNRYYVVTKQLQDLVYSADSTFSWDAVTMVKVYCSTLIAGSNSTYTPSDNWYIALDGIRFDNVTTENPLYGLSGYSIVKTSNGYPIIKNGSYSGYIEFRFALDVQ